MFLRLRWYGLDLNAHRRRVVNASLPAGDVECLKQIRDRYKIPYTETFRLAVLTLKQSLWNRYREVMKEAGMKVPPEWRSYWLDEHLDEAVKEAFQDTRFSYKTKIAVSKRETGKRFRVCAHMTEGDVLFLKNVREIKGGIGDYLSYLLRSTFCPLGRTPSGRSPGLLEQYKPHKRITLGVRTQDYKLLQESIKRYRLKYSEKLTKSEVFVLTYHVFRHLRGMEQQKIMKSEQTESEERGKIKKISISFSHIGYRHPRTQEPKIRHLRAALYYLLRSRNFRELVDFCSSRNASLGRS